eukprot:gene34102-42050_t
MRSQALNVKPTVYVSSCDGTKTSTGIAYSWSVKVNGLTSLSFASQSKDPSQFLLPAYSLSVGSIYDIKLTASLLSSSLSSSGSVRVLVIQSPLMASVVGGNSRNILLSTGLTLDASLSYDPDVASGPTSASKAGLTFSWSCQQLTPVLSDTCGLEVTGSSTLPSLQLFANPVSIDANATSLVVLTVSDATQSRSSQYSVIVTVVKGLLPEVSLASSVTAAKMNPSSRLVLTGGVVIPSNAMGSAVWTVSDSSIQLDKIALMPLTVDVIGSSSIYLALTANSLPAASTLTFYLTCELLNGQSSQAAVTVVTNSPPLAGVFLVDPSVGLELSDVFRMTAAQWTDVDVPLSYQFAILSPSGASQILRSRSEMSYMSSTLPAGSSSDRNKLTSSVIVFDSFLANSSSSFAVTVNPQSHADISRISNLAMSVLQAGDGSTDSIYSSAAISGVCRLNDKTCPSDCSGHGSCSFIQTDSGAALTSCKVGQVGCNAVCDCISGWFEESCAVDDAGWAAATAVRFQIVSRLSALTTLEDATEDSVSGWSGALVSATQNSFQLSSPSITSAHSLAALIVRNALLLELDHTVISGVLDTLNLLASATVSSRRRRRLTVSSGTSTDSAQITNTELILQQFSQLVAAGMLAGQGAVSNTQSQFRMITQAIAASSNASIIDPQSSSSLLKVSSVLMNAGLYGCSDFQSNPLQIHFNSDMPCVSTDGSASCSIDVDVVLQNNSPLDVSDRTPEPYFSACRFDDYSVHQYHCPNNFVLNASCNGTAQILSSRCPYIQPHSVCNSLVRSNSVYSGCVAVAYTSTNTTCRCPIKGPSLSASRRLIVSNDDDGNSSSALSSGSANFVSMLSFLSKDFTTTILSADSLSVSSVKSSWKVLATLGSLAVAMVMFGLFAHKADGRMKKIKPTDKQPEAPEAGALSKFKKASLRGSELINGVKARLSTTEIQKFLRKRTSSADVEAN